MKIKKEPFILLILSAVILAFILNAKKEQDFLGGDFSISAINGEFKLKDFRNKNVILYFGFRYCPDICPTMLASLATSYKKLSKEQQSQIQIMFISLDPKRDSLESLKEYITFFHEDFLAGVDSKENIHKIALQYGINYIVNKPTGTDQNKYNVDHFPNALIIDRNGLISGTIEHNAKISEIDNIFKKLVKE